RNFMTIMFPVGIGLMLYRRVRNRGHVEVQRFVKRASTLKEVRLVTFSRGQFTIVAHEPTTKTYVKLNALLTASNARLFRGEPMTMIVRDDMDEAETRTILQSPGVQFVREERGRSKGSRARGEA